MPDRTTIRPWVGCEWGNLRLPLEALRADSLRMATAEWTRVHMITSFATQEPYVSLADRLTGQT